MVLPVPKGKIRKVVKEELENLPINIVVISTPCRMD